METETRPVAADARSIGTDEPTARRSRRRWWLIGGAVVVAGLVAFVLAWFQPHKVFVNDRVDQAVPTARPSPTSDAADGSDGTASDGTAADQAATTTTPPAPDDLATGNFVSLGHSTSGTVRVLRLADGRRFVRLEGFETDNGPDLFVYLSTNPPDGAEGTFDDEYVNLGRLQGNIGDQNYELPADVDPSAYASVVIWCDRFDSAFGAADLEPSQQ